MAVFSMSSEIRFSNAQERKRVADILTKNRDVSSEIKERINKIASQKIVLTKG